MRLDLTHFSFTLDLNISFSAHQWLWLPSPVPLKSDFWTLSFGIKVSFRSKRYRRWLWGHFRCPYLEQNRLPEYTPLLASFDLWMSLQGVNAYYYKFYTYVKLCFWIFCNWSCICWSIESRFDELRPSWSQIMVETSLFWLGHRRYEENRSNGLTLGWFYAFSQGDNSIDFLRHADEIKFSIFSLRKLKVLANPGWNEPQQHETHTIVTYHYETPLDAHKK